MSIFLDTSVYDEILKLKELGIVKGVTTNPTILKKENNIGDMEKIKELLTKIAKLIHPYPLSVQVTSLGKSNIIEEAKRLKSIGENVVVKVPIHGPNGEIENLEAVNKLEELHNIRVNVTAIMNAQQCLVAGISGASYVSILGGRVNDIGYNVIKEIEYTKSIFDRKGINSKIIIGSVRENINVLEWIKAGADIVTLNPTFLYKMVLHPYTRDTVQMFYNDI